MIGDHNVAPMGLFWWEYNCLLANKKLILAINLCQPANAQSLQSFSFCNIITFSRHSCLSHPKMTAPPKTIYCLSFLIIAYCSDWLLHSKQR